jgi:hypothetical protein
MLKTKGFLLNMKHETALLTFLYGGFKKGSAAPKAKAIRSGVAW